MKQLWLIFLIGLGFVASGCAGSDAGSNATAAPSLEAITPTPISAAQNTPLPASDTTAEEAETLVLWWPDVLAPGENADVSDVLSQQIAAFDESEEGTVDIEFRLKRYGDVGGIMSTLRSASNVAPGAMPDLTLIRREDLVSAADSGLIYPLDGLITAGIIGDLYDPALLLGQVEGQLYGLPYMLEVNHTVTQEAGEDTPLDWSFDSVLARENVWLFPARRVNTVNTMFLLQYLDAGGTLPGVNGVPPLSTDALMDVLTFYEQASRANMLDLRVVEFTSPTEYAAELTLGDVDTAVVSSTLYLDEVYAGRSLIAGPLPTASGQPTSALNGWIWVVTTSNPERQVVAADFINWMMDIDRHVTYAQTIHMLPSQRQAVAGMDDTIVDVPLMDAILTNSRIFSVDLVSSSVARGMQAAVISVISGDATAEEAVTTLMDEINGD